MTNRTFASGFVILMTPVSPVRDVRFDLHYGTLSRGKERHNSNARPVKVTCCACLRACLVFLSHSLLIPHLRLHHTATPLHPHSNPNCLFLNQSHHHGLGADKKRRKTLSQARQGQAWSPLLSPFLPHGEDRPGYIVERRRVECVLVLLPCTGVICNSWCVTRGGGLLLKAGYDLRRSLGSVRWWF